MVAAAIPSRPKLRRIPMPKQLPPGLALTMSVGQWDGLLQAGYDIGAMLIELDDNERPIAAYQRLM